jgi:hypothetical protein
VSACAAATKSASCCDDNPSPADTEASPIKPGAAAPVQTTGVPSSRATDADADADADDDAKE